MKTLTLLSSMFLSGCAFVQFSDRTGGTGMVLVGKTPVSGVEVTISDLGGVIKAQTNEKGIFNIPDSSEIVFIPLMSNPAYHDVTLTIKNNNCEPYTRTLNKSVFDTGFIDFGIISLVCN